jgi:hypothetical protein
MAAFRALFPGPALEGYFRDIIATEPGVDTGTRDRLAEKCARPIARMWVTSAQPLPAPPLSPRAEPTEPTPQAAPAARAEPAAVQAPAWTAEADSAIDSGQGLEDIAPWPEDALDAPAPQLGSAPAPVVAPAAFDPFAFSVVALLKREGRAGVGARLGDITARADLLALADAQHLALPDGLGDPEAIRTAIIDSAEARLAGRRAAAS